MAGLFGGLFDFNDDGKMDALEQAAEFSAFADMMDESECEEKESQLRDAGLDSFDLEMMSEEERIEALEDAGLDPDDFDF